MAGHLRIGEGAEVGAQAGVISDIAPGTRVLGSLRSNKRLFPTDCYAQEDGKERIAGAQFDNDVFSSSLETAINRQSDQ